MFATKAELEAYIDDPENEEELTQYAYDHLELPRPGEFDFPPYWLADDIVYHCTDNIRTTKQYANGDIATSSGDDCHYEYPERPDRLRARAMRYLNEYAEDILVTVSEGYWSKYKVGEIEMIGKIPHMCLGSISAWDEEYEMQADDGECAYFYIGPMCVYAFVPCWKTHD